MADILRGYEFSRSAARFRDTTTGRFVSRTRIMGVMEQQVNSAESRIADIVQGLHNRDIAPGYAQTLMRDELRRLNLQNAALGKGGFDRLTQSDFGRVGHQTRDTYARITRLVDDVQAGRASLAQALQRVRGYVGEARQQFFIAEREALRQSGRNFEERRVLGAAEHCKDCLDYAARGWQPLGTLPIPGNASVCGKACRCSLVRREVTEEQPARAERVLA
jgi:hypothetical protein